LVLDIYEHLTKEVRSPFEADTAFDHKQILKRAHWGIECVMFLVDHLRREIIGHPYFRAEDAG
jgi:hypothetical protein